MIDGTLIIGSNTTIELGEGVIIKQKTTGQNLLKNSDTVNGNTNITIIGGTWDYNSPNVPDPNDPHNRHAIVLQNVIRLTLSKVKVVNALKYAWIIANTSYVTVDGLDFNTLSDGLHFMGPLNYADIRNLKGVTGDNLLAFTIGDYSAYELSRGNMTNIHVSGIYCDNTFEPVRLVGNTGYYFDNIVIENIFGSVSTGRVVRVIQDTDLLYTDVRNLTIKNVDCTAIGEQINIDCMAGKNITIENVSGGNPAYNVVKVDTNANLSNLILKNIVSPDNATLDVIVTHGFVQNLFVHDIIGNFSGTSATLFRLDNVGNINIANLSQVNGSNSIIAGTVATINVSNFNVSGLQSVISKTGGNLTTLNINNGYASYTSRFAVNSSATTGELRITTRGLSFPNDTASRFSVSGLGTVSLNGYDFRSKDLSLLTPRNGDMIFNTLSTFGTGIGLYLYDTTAWRKL